MLTIHHPVPTGPESAIMLRIVALLGDGSSASPIPVILGVLVTMLIGMILVALRGRRAKPFPQLASSRGAKAMTNPPPGIHERRRAERRFGQPKRVIIVDLGFKISSQRGYVMDRSLTGIRIALANHIVIGTTIQIRPMNAPEDVTWVSAVVKNGRYIGDYYEVGCEFERTPSYRELVSLG